MLYFWMNHDSLVVSTPLKNISQNANLLQRGVTIKNVRRHHPPDDNYSIWTDIYKIAVEFGEIMFRFSRLHPPKFHVSNLKKQTTIRCPAVKVFQMGFREPSINWVEKLRSNQAAIFTPVFAPRVLHQPVLVCTLPASVKVRKVSKVPPKKHWAWLPKNSSFLFGEKLSLEVQRRLKEQVFTKDHFFRFGNFNHPKLWTIILIALDFQGLSRFHFFCFCGKKTSHMYNKAEILQSLSFRKQRVRKYLWRGGVSSTWKKMFEQKTPTYSFSQTKNNRMLLANETNIVKLSWNILKLSIPGWSEWM